MSSPAIPSGRDRHAGASRKGNIVLIVPLPACPAVGRDRRRQQDRLPRFGGTGHLPVTILKLFPLASDLLQEVNPFNLSR